MISVTDRPSSRRSFILMEKSQVALISNSGYKPCGGCKFNPPQFKYWQAGQMNKAVPLTISKILTKTKVVLAKSFF